MTLRRASSILLVLLFASAPLAAALTRLLRYPDLNGGSVVFTYADDLWIAPSAGGRATRLTHLAGKNLNAKISPDGAFVAFTALAEGNYDVYLVPALAPARGGEARRLTFHPALDMVAGWTPDGRSILFTSRRNSFTHPLDKLFTVPREGGAAVPLPLAQGGPGSFSPDGKQIAFNRNSSESWNPWRGYRGGRHAAISVYDFAARRETTVAPSNANDVFPMWWGGSIYFASDRDGRMNLYQYELSSQALRQLTHHREADVRHPSLAGGRSPRIVYELGGELRVLSLAGGGDEALRITVEEALPEKAPRQAAAAPYITSFAVAPDGTRALVSGRGDLFEIMIATGTAVNLTQTPGVREHGATWSPDGREIAYVSDASGEYEIYVRGAAAGRRLTRQGAGFRQGLRWSPDGRKLLFVDQTQSLYGLDVAGGTVVRIDTSHNAPIDAYDWTPDSASVVYAKTGNNQLSRLYRYGYAGGKSEPLGDGMTDDASPAVDASGKRIYFLSARDFRTSFSDFEQTFNFNDTVGVYAMPLDGVAAAGVERLPIDSGSISQLTFAAGRLFYLVRDRRTGAQALRSFDLAKSQEETIAAGVADYRAARGGVLVQAGDRLS
ncbi:MAG: tricorn protease [Acidobacteriota bacterium]|jgi:tricorn protease|nr:tricorn protease [Acidobacteriota bacterium]